MNVKTDFFTREHVNWGSTGGPLWNVILSERRNPLFWLFKSNKGTKTRRRNDIFFYFLKCLHVFYSYKNCCKICKICRSKWVFQSGQPKKKLKTPKSLVLTTDLFVFSKKQYSWKWKLLNFRTSTIPQTPV